MDNHDLHSQHKQQTQHIISAPRVHAIAVIGGAVAGAAVADQLAQAGHHVVVFEQNARPYGKIEDGLPRWHEALRQKEFDSIDSKLNHPQVHFVPNTTIGRDVDMQALCTQWGFSAVVLACGAWRDRLLPLAGAEQCVGRGLLYQNPFIYWFNHHEEHDYPGPRYTVPDDAVVIGGGLASIDVAKALVLVTTQNALRTRGIDPSIEELEHQGIPKYLASHNLTWEQLALHGSTLYYRRRIEDMPLTDDSAVKDATDSEKQRKVGDVRKRIIQKACEKYMFRVQPMMQPLALLTDPQTHTVTGVRFQHMQLTDDHGVIPSAETIDTHTSLVVSSIGSIPEPLPGLPMRGELFAFQDQHLGTFAAFPTVFGAGNVVTGRGNIVVSRRHGLEVAGSVLAFLNAQQGAGTTELVLNALMQRVRERQHAVGYSTYAQWMQRWRPKHGASSAEGT